jgi:hypothetical protein
VVDVFYVKDMFGLKLHTRRGRKASNASCATPSRAWPNGLGRETMALTRPRQDDAGLRRRGAGRRGLRAAYDARPPYQRNDYLGWINRAKREDTKQKRLKQMLAELRAGEGYMNMPWHPKD